MNLDEFPIDPYGGAGPVRLGMNAETVSAILGPPGGMARRPSGGRSEYRQGLVLDFAGDSRLEAITLFRPAVASLGGQDLLRLPEPVAFLASLDPDGRALAGTTVFRELGISVTAMDSEDDASVTLFEKGAFDGLWESMERIGRR